MEETDHGREQHRPSEHSLSDTKPGAKEPAGKIGEANRPVPGAKDQDQLEEHSLPGTNQAGKGPATPDNDAP